VKCFTSNVAMLPHVEHEVKLCTTEVNMIRWIFASASKGFFLTKKKNELIKLFELEPESMVIRKGR